MGKLTALKIGLIWYAITLIVYGIILYIFREYEIFSTFYHISLLFPIVYVVLEREKLRDIGFRKGVFDVSALIFIIGLPLCNILFQFFIFDKTFNVVLGYGFLLTVVIAPITEEVFFRGFLQEKLCGVLSNRYLSIFLVAVLFGLIHLPRLAFGTYSVEGIFSSIVLGCLFGYVYSEGKSIVYPIVFHLLWNLSVSLF